jgi:hypothetical protein
VYPLLFFVPFPRSLGSRLFLYHCRQEIITQSGSALPHCIRYIESEIERLSQPAETSKEAPLPTHKWGAMPWEQDKDESGVYAELVPDETLADGKTKSAVRPLLILYHRSF